MKKYILLLFLISACGGCRQAKIFEDYTPIGNEQWRIDDTVRFEVTLPETVPYDFRICIRHTTDYEMANLWCFVQLQDSLNRTVRDTLNIKIAEPDGRWTGKGNAIKTVCGSLTRFSDTLPAGKYTVGIIQGMRSRSLNGIKNVGLEIRPLVSGERK